MQYLVRLDKLQEEDNMRPSLRLGRFVFSLNQKLGLAKLKHRLRRLKQPVVYLTYVVLVLSIFNLDLLLPVEEHTTVVDVVEPPRPRPRQPGDSFPQKIWQTWKTDPTLFGIKETSRAMTWLQKNPAMRYEVITDGNDMTYVEAFFGPHGFNRPDIVEFYRSMNIQIIKADLLRYMILYAEGGIYADIDVEAVKPFHRFIPERHNEEDYDLIIGIEVDMPHFKQHAILGKKSQSFCQWTIISRPHHPVMMRLIEGIMKWLKGVAKDQSVSLQDVELNFDQVITGTGPSAFTAAVLEEMNKATGGSLVTWDMFHNLDESKVVGRVLVLNVEAFCAGQGHSDSGNHGSRFALVKHHYHASNWPSKHPRYRHPAYGTVEECNWDKQCVDQWDKDVSEYEIMTDDEKKAKILERLQLLRDSTEHKP